ncbi:biotin/lipoyl-containing protein [Streptomyces sp. NPDC050997]|uniref:acetyl-CoA carboxylase biotin carboxyl carrier protein n=1 Tax=Streptomyces sp. NPDC050997 TaxID=3155519 RepID=UPI00342F31B4
MSVATNGGEGGTAFVTAQDVDRVVGVLCEQAVALSAREARAPSLVRVTAGDLSVQVEWREAASSSAVTSVVPAVVPAVVLPPAAPAAAVEEELPTAPRQDDGHRVCAHTVGVFYHAAEPGAEPFVVEGDVVEPGRQVGLIEAMKLMIPVEADQGGRVAAILVTDGAAVEHGQPLIVLEPQS